MKRIIKIIGLLVALILVFAFGFVMTLHFTEFRPSEEIDLTIEPGSNVPASVQLGDVIRVFTFNTGYASLSETEDFVMDGGVKGRMDSLGEVEANLQGIQEIIVSASADIILLQEVDYESSRSYNTRQADFYQSQFPAYSSAHARNYDVLFVPFPFSLSQMMGRVESGIQSLIQYEVREATRYQLPGEFSWPLRLANLKRCILVSRLPIADSDKEFVVINVHLSAYDDGTMRIEETNYLKALMKAETDAGNYVLVGGDFNQMFETAIDLPIYELKDPNYWEAFPIETDWFEDNGFSFAVDVTTPTCRLLHQPYDTENPENNQYYAIDGFIVSNNIAFDPAQTMNENFKYSDHNPVVVQIRLLP